MVLPVIRLEKNRTRGPEVTRIGGRPPSPKCPCPFELTPEQVWLIIKPSGPRQKRGPNPEAAGTDRSLGCTRGSRLSLRPPRPPSPPGRSLRKGGRWAGSTRAPGRRGGLGGAPRVPAPAAPLFAPLVLIRAQAACRHRVPQAGTLELSHLQEGTYTFQLTVTDTAGQRSSDNVSVTVLPRAFSTGVSLDQKMGTRTATAQPRTTGPSKDARGGSLLEKPQKVTAPNQPPASSNTEKRNHSAFWGPESPTDPGMPDSSSSGKNRKKENYIFESKSDRGGGEHPAPEAGAVLPLALGLAITASLLLMVACRLRLVKQKLKKARPITSEESDYLINGMYL
ncbi:low-density lipoprotein receptor-related protein 11 [Equus quagga]|uniref:low-density lipoprotein receptor-related protein 11 n=1 Tax=Equus quagga TaxID=89248 RepID=UPI001EE332F3|nr:low-density lipoprotein receptor-related protein 11 [Equus quagga]